MTVCQGAEKTLQIWTFAFKTKGTCIGSPEAQDQRAELYGLNSG